MAFTLAAFLCLTLVLAYMLQDGLGNFGVNSTPTSPAVTGTCEKIAKAISSKSQVYYPGRLRVLCLCAPPINMRSRLPGV